MNRPTPTFLLLLLGIALVVAAPAPAADAPWFDHVLVSNDDGIDDPRLIALAQAFAKVARVTVVAPLANCSGSSNYCSVFQGKALTVEPRDLGPGITAYGVDGFPGDCMLLALETLLADDLPDLVVSGVNSGPNLADAWIASGTLGVARLAANRGLPALALSALDDHEPAMLAAVPAWSVDLAASATVRDLPDGAYLSVNFPKMEMGEIKGVRWTGHGRRIFHDAYTPGEPDADGRVIGTLNWWTEDGDQPPDQDVALYRDGWITVSPMRVGDLDEKALSSPPVLPDWRP